MKYNRNQALYRALPDCWISYSDPDKSDYKYACQVIGWYTKEVQGINKDIIREDILRRVNSFQSAGGDVKEDFSPKAIGEFEFVEAYMNEDMADIKCKINPATYYCPKCNTVTFAPNATQRPFCKKCSNGNTGTRMNQLQMVYACECGYADGVKPISKEPLFYHSKDKESQFKFFTATNAKREMNIPCPTCNKFLRPKNATDSRLFYSQSGSIVNLYNESYASAIKKYGFDAEALMLAKWFDIISNDEFLQCLESQKDFFEPKTIDVNDPAVQAMAKAFNKSPEEVARIMVESGTQGITISEVRQKIDEIIPLTIFQKTNTRLITSELMEFDILKYPREVISLPEAIQKNIEIGVTVDEDDVYEVIRKMSIQSMQISEQVQVVNYAYGYTRLRSCPDGTTETRGIRLKGFKNKVFTSILETEGLLVELDMLAVFRWLVDNGIVSDEELIADNNEAKRWFLENIHLASINHFSSIPGGGENRVTKIVYSLLHTISHMMIISAGRHSGLGRDSISEMLFADACSFFIYPTSSEGVTLGSLSGMFETEIELFLKDALTENEICTFDPVCSTSQNGACLACTYLGEVNCTHFNKDLSRAYLYGGTIRINDEEIVIKKGFWR